MSFTIEWLHSHKELYVLLGSISIAADAKLSDLRKAIDAQLLPVRNDDIARHCRTTGASSTEFVFVRDFMAITSRQEDVLCVRDAATYLQRICVSAQESTVINALVCKCPRKLVLMRERGVVSTTEGFLLVGESEKLANVRQRIMAEFPTATTAVSKDFVFVYAGGAAFVHREQEATWDLHAIRQSPKQVTKQPDAKEDATWVVIANPSLWQPSVDQKRQQQRDSLPPANSVHEPKQQQQQPPPLVEGKEIESPQAGGAVEDKKAVAAAPVVDQGVQAMEDIDGKSDSSSSASSPLPAKGSLTHKRKRDMMIDEFEIEELEHILADDDDNDVSKDADYVPGSAALSKTRTPNKPRHRRTQDELRAAFAVQKKTGRHRVRVCEQCDHYYVQAHACGHKVKRAKTEPVKTEVVVVAV
jgi:hypothetical protein